MMFEVHVLVSLPFLDRDRELARLTRFARGGSGHLAVVYGRRRCGKSTLVQRIVGPSDVYFLADERESGQQIGSLAEEIDRTLPSFAAARYPTWDAIFDSLEARGERRVLVLDEFPYLVGVAPELPSVLQRRIDRGSLLAFVLCGSSQRMMHGLVLDRSAPLFGRAEEILRITPLPAGFIGEALRLPPIEAVESWSVWGGVPRYWELASAFSGWRDAARDLVLDRHGVLHDEPMGLLLDDLRSAAQASSILGLVAAGCHRLAEIAARLEKPAGALTRPVAQLVDLGYLRREVPFGEDERTSKRTLYRVDDPFLAFWYRFVLPVRSLLARGLVAPVEARLEQGFAAHVGAAWEQLARDAVPALPIAGTAWGPAARWWGPGGAPEFDLVAESLDGDAVLVGEVKWAARPDLDRWRAELAARAARAPFVRGRRVVCALWTKHGIGPDVVGPGDVLAALR